MGVPKTISGSQRVGRTERKRNMEKTLITVILGSVLALGAVAQSQPSSKITAKTANLTLLPKTTGTGQWVTVLNNSLKTSNQKDLLITASLECGLFTSTLTSSKLMQKDTSSATSSVQVRVLLDGRQVEPGVVVYGRRTQTLSSTLEGALSGCLQISTNADGTLSIVLNEACVTPEVIELVLESMDAASFQWVAVDVPQGVHQISVQARIDTSGSATTGSWSALATIGKGTFSAESIRLIRDPNVILEVP